MKFMNLLDGSVVLNWAAGDWGANTPSPATIKFVPEANGIDFKIYDGSVDHTAPGAPYLASTLFTDLNLNTINDPEEVGDYLAAQAAGNTATFEITIVEATTLPVITGVSVTSRLLAKLPASVLVHLRKSITVVMLLMIQPTQTSAMAQHQLA